jgi:lysyl-tRNA synthetase class 2
MTDWRPSASPEALRARARLLADIRQFFSSRKVMEVETPLLASAGVTDPALEPFCVNAEDGQRFLQTSPEYAMKRLLAAGSGDIYQIAKAFRASEQGARHNPEYTILEWYRLGFDHHQLIREVAELLLCLLDRPGWQVWPWQQLFSHVLNVDAVRSSTPELVACASAVLGHEPPHLDRDGLLDLLMSHAIEPAIAPWGVVFVVDYPASQAALARRFERDGSSWGARFECYVDGIEIANGYWEAGDADDLRARFAVDNQIRETRGLPTRPIDERLLAALEAGLPDCAGVALGVDRVLMLQQNSERIDDTLAFPWELA